MIEKKFKALIKKEENWLYFSLENFHEIRHLINEETICQHIGIKDIDKNDIYERDLLITFSWETVAIGNQIKNAKNSIVGFVSYNEVRDNQYHGFVFNPLIEYNHYPIITRNCKKKIIGNCFDEKIRKYIKSYYRIKNLYLLNRFESGFQYSLKHLNENILKEYDCYFYEEKDE